MYLDTAATAKYRDIDDIIIKEITSAMKTYWRNPSSLYVTDVKNRINECKKNIAEFIGATPEEIIFTSGASESNNTVIRGFDDYVSKDDSLPSNIVTTPIEHKSILMAIENKALKSHVCLCNVDEYGGVDHEYLEFLLKTIQYQPTLVSIGMANSEIGTIQVIEEISELVHKYNAVLHVDATQTFGKIPINVNKLGIDMMSASGHKLSTVLKGIGILYVKKGMKISPLIYGLQQNALRGGTENTYGIIGLSKAIELCNLSEENLSRMSVRADYFINSLYKNFGCKLNGTRFYRLPNNINVTFPQNITGESLLYTLDLSGIQVSIGSACNSRSIEPSHVLKAIGLTDEEAMKTVRFTLPDDITKKDIDFVIEEIKKAIAVIES